MDSLKLLILASGMAALSAGCGSQGNTTAGGTAGSGTGGDGTGGGGTGGQGASSSTGGASTSTGTGGTGELTTCGPDDSGVCIPVISPGCPIGYALLKQGFCDLGDGGSGRCCLPAGDTFTCGSDEVCNTATQYCLVTNGGPCCGIPSYACADLPRACLSPGADCTCFDQADCPCGGGPGPCAEGTGIETMCQSSQGGLFFSCPYP